MSFFICTLQVCIGMYYNRSGLSPAESQFIEPSLTLANTKRDVISREQVMTQQLAIPHGLRVTEFPWIGTQVILKRTPNIFRKYMGRRRRYR